YFEPFADPTYVQQQIAKGDTSFLLLSFDSDWRFSTSHSRRVTDELRLAGAPVTFQEVESRHGHDSFLFEIPEYHETVAGFLDRLATERGLGRDTTWGSSPE
ncbi:MAG: homoserine O-acetyltransferase, partial [Solirubrobacterales bacterium]